MEKKKIKVSKTFTQIIKKNTLLLYKTKAENEEKNTIDQKGFGDWYFKATHKYNTNPPLKSLNKLARSLSAPKRKRSAWQTTTNRIIFICD